MWWFAPEQQRWVIQPLIDAGMAQDAICALLYRFAVDADGLEVVHDQPPPIRAAWTHTIDRMLMLPGPVD
ncbi:hypothetical protein [Blastococcus sp. PRF04-17]|uniref:hypothetical protein n=1 Tax=Blastococcus sp. PRF04-17 TaxID=2933797 RepID=UPI001FF25CF2|nr:hypothetical protein [Blastococcus sp. PRF04-17]UOY03480.1 hypothetical protein MVA48_09210 [Blastococcus sp. PRF04-17]